MSLVYPAKVDDPTQVDGPKINNAITFLLSEDKIYYYSGQYYPKSAPGPKGPTKLEETNFGPDGVRKLLAEGNEYVLSGKVELQKKLDKKQIQDSVYVNMLTDLKKKDQALKVLIKTDDKATCKNFIDLIDELKIAEIGVVAPVEIMASELDLLKEKLK
jgi:hypothetical protein